MMLVPSILLIALGIFTSATSYKRITCPDGLNSATNEACCTFFALRDDLQKNLFLSQCGEEAHEALRLTWQDSIGFSKSGAFPGGGADGSILIFSDIETTFEDNNGISGIVDALKPFLQTHNVTAGDLIQFAAAVGFSNCPGAPQLQFLAGRLNATGPATNGSGLLPTDTVNTMLARVEDVGLTPTDLVSCLAAHSVGRADTVVPGIEAVPFDTTPFTFDTQFYLETLLKPVGFPFGMEGAGEASSPLPASGELRLQSDFALARDPRTACAWQAMINNQALMMSSFKAVMARLAVVGQTTAKLIDCSEVVPVPVPPAGKAATFPASTGPQDIQQACPEPFPALLTDPGLATLIPACPDGDTDINDCRN